MALDGMSLDQLRTFVAAVDEGSFSAAGRKLRRAQSVVSQTLANLEEQLGVKLFDRSGRYPRLTDHGRALLSDARSIADGMDCFKARAKTLRDGLEPELSVSIDAMYPMPALTEALGAFRHAFPYTPLRLYVEALGAVVEPVLQGALHHRRDRHVAVDTQQPSQRAPLRGAAGHRRGPGASPGRV